MRKRTESPPVNSCSTSRTPTENGPSDRGIRRSRGRSARSGKINSTEARSGRAISTPSSPLLLLERQACSKRSFHSHVRASHETAGAKRPDDGIGCCSARAERSGLAAWEVSKKEILVHGSWLYTAQRGSTRRIGTPEQVARPLTEVHTCSDRLHY